MSAQLQAMIEAGWADEPEEPRDWTLSDAADAEDDRRHREWWRRDPYADPDYRANSPDADEE